MKIDRSKSKKTSSEVPADCKVHIDRLKMCNPQQLLEELKKFKTWNYDKCELYHWVDVLDMFDDILEQCCRRERENQWSLPCDQFNNCAGQDKELLNQILQFTALLIEHSFSRHLYNSMEHLTTLLASSDMQVVLSVLSLLFVFSKRSNFITRLSTDKKQELLSRLSFLAESWGGKENGFGLAECCQDLPMSKFPSSATTLHFEYYSDENPVEVKTDKRTINIIHINDVDQIKDKSLAEIMEELISTHQVPRNKQMQLFTQLRLAHSFSDCKKRVQFVQARLQALSIIIYCNPAAAQDDPNLLYNGFIEELVDILQLEGRIEIKSAALHTLTTIVHLDRNSPLITIIDCTETASYHGFLPVLVRNCIQSLINHDDKFPTPFATSLFSFLYYLASYERGGEALVSCGMMESLLKIINWNSTEPEHITFVTRSVRVINLITNMDMSVFQAQSGLNIFVRRLETEIQFCRRELNQPVTDNDVDHVDHDYSTNDQPMEVNNLTTNVATDEIQSEDKQSMDQVQCYPQRSVLLKSMLNFLKKAIQDATFADCTRHLMDGSLPKSLRHMISNVNYYGPSLFLLSVDLVAVYVFQEPALLSSLQESQLTKDIMDALLEKPIPPTPEILSALPNIFTALCLNNAGIRAFQARKPFEKIFRVLITPEYLPAMRRRRGTDTNNDTAANLGKSMYELMRHQPSLRADAMTAIVNLLRELCELGDNPAYICCKSAGKSGGSDSHTNSVSAVPSSGGASASSGVGGGANDTNFSDDVDADDDEDSASPPAPLPGQTQSTIPIQTPQQKPVRTAVPLTDYIMNIMRFLDAILTNNTTDDDVREFLRQNGLDPLLRIMRLKNLPIDFPGGQACSGVANVCKSILAREPKLVQEALKALESVPEELQVFHRPLTQPGGSVLPEEFVQVAAAHSTTDPSQLANLTPLLHSMSAAYSYDVMFMHICRIGYLETRNKKNSKKWSISFMAYINKKIFHQRSNTSRGVNIVR